jgi:glycogen synthase
MGLIESPRTAHPTLQRSQPIQPDVVHLNSYVHGALSWRSPILVAGHSWSLSWPVYVVGEGHHPVTGRVRYHSLRPLGRLSSTRLASWLSRAAIYALPARYEPLGLSVLEAGLAGCALVLGDIPSLREIWDGAARFVPPDDADRLWQTLQTLTQDRAELAWFAAAARTRALHYSPERMLVGYLGAYEELLQARPRFPGHRHGMAFGQAG